MMSVSPAIFDQMDQKSRIWIYTASRFLNKDEVALANDKIQHFANQWTAHSNKLTATGWIESDVFLILTVDETQAGASGCSIDASVRFIKDLGMQLNLDWFERMSFVYLDMSGLTKMIHKNELKSAYDSGTIHDQTLFLNTLVKTKDEYQNSWMVPFGNSWHKRLM
jgi:hypothetical protein